MAKSADVEIRLRAIDDTARGIASAKRRLKQFQKLADQQEKASKQQEKTTRVQKTVSQKQESAARQQIRAAREQERAQARAGRREESRQARIIRAQEVAEERSVVRQERSQRRARTEVERMARHQERVSNPHGRAARAAGIRQQRAASQGFRGGASSSYATAVDESQKAPAESSGGGVLGFASARLLGGFAAVGGAAGIATQAADFETSMTKVQQKAGATAEQMAAVRKDVLDLATSGQVAASIDEIASAFERGAAGGIPLDELREFALLSAKAADAFEMSAEDVGNAFAGFQNVLKVPKEDLERVADLINSLADSGIADESGIVRYIDQAGAMSKTIGLTVNETAAFGAALANLKVPAFKAATAMNSIMTKLLAPQSMSEPASMAFEVMTGGSEKFAKSLNEDADAAIVNLMDRLKAFDKSKRAGLVADVFGQDHLDVVMQMVEGVDEIKRNLTQAAGTDWFGSLSKSYALKRDDIWSEWQLLKNGISELAIDVGSGGMPLMKGALLEAQAIAKDISHELQTFDAKIDMSEFQAAKTAVGELSDAIGTLLGMGTDDSPLGHFFDRMAAAANATSGSINIAKDAMQAMGLLTDDGDSPKVKADRRSKTMDALSEISPPIGVARDGYNGWRGAFGRTFLGEPGHGSEEAPPGIGRTTGSFVSGYRGGLAPAPAEDRMWGETSAADRQAIGNRFADNGFDLGKIRQELEAGGQSVTTGGTAAGAAIQAAGATAGTQLGTAAASALQSQVSGIGAAIGASAAASFNASVKIPSMPSGPAGLPRANAAPATTMPDAGRAGG